MSTVSYLPKGLPAPHPAEPQLEQPYWNGLRDGRLLIQRCKSCETWQWGPEWICHKCLSPDVTWTEIGRRGRIYSWERIWHPVHSALKGHTPYVAVLVELPDAGNVRMVGNLLGDPLQAFAIGDEVEAEFEAHDDADPPYALAQWRLVRRN